MPPQFLFLFKQQHRQYRKTSWAANKKNDHDKLQIIITKNTIQHAIQGPNVFSYFQGIKGCRWSDLNDGGDDDANLTAFMNPLLYQLVVDASIFVPFLRFACLQKIS